MSKQAKKKAAAKKTVELDKRQTEVDKDAQRMYGKPYAELSQHEKIALNRVGYFTYGELESHVNRLSILVADMKALMESMSRLELESVEVKGATKLHKAEEEVILFLRNLQSALTEARYRDR